ncbi:TPA: flavin reductase family protein [Enterococcus faecium]|nr:flavin reductase family protein [Enterococcus faecium]HEM7665086.1 flavin reductase family protein [Enterococcus faecium]HEM7694765.1 flavin reductase family protein [Enterococcus faecium]HEM7727020.1 flavin reductase family protein [Enterococcus faecium]HEM8319410.1 flavin reductase family protein [Enterococcus faecium]
MFERSPSELTERENYKLLIGSVIPRPVAVVTTKSAKDIVNIAPFSYFNIVSSNRPILSLAIQRKQDAVKDTAKNILETREAVIHILDEDNVEEVNKTAANLPNEESELYLTDLTLTDSVIISVPALTEAKVRFETSLYEHVEMRNKNKVTADLFLLEVQKYHLNETVYDDKTGRIDPRKLNAVSRLAGNDYAAIGEIFTIARPE